MSHMLFKVKEDSSLILNATIAKSLDILQNIATRDFSIIAKRRGTSLKIVDCDLKTDMLYYLIMLSSLILQLPL